jgi:hypothetical protein
VRRSYCGPGRRTLRRGPNKELPWLDQVFRVFAKHGPAAFTASREAAIMHETGHGIVGTAEGFRIRELRIFRRTAKVWAGRCQEAETTWSTGPNTSAHDDLRRARFTIGGLAGEAMCGLDKPGSSIEELALSQMLGANAGKKLVNPLSSDEARETYIKQLWHEQVWGVALSILKDNHGPFFQVVELLNRHERIKSNRLDKVLDQVKRRTAS